MSKICFIGVYQSTDFVIQFNYLWMK